MRIVPQYTFILCQVCSQDGKQTINIIVALFLLCILLCPHIRGDVCCLGYHEGRLAGPW